MSTGVRVVVLNANANNARLLVGVFPAGGVLLSWSRYCKRERSSGECKESVASSQQPAVSSAVANEAFRANNGQGNARLSVYYVM
jgi:hypothetical protein